MLSLAHFNGFRDERVVGGFVTALNFGDDLAEDPVARCNAEHDKTHNLVPIVSDEQMSSEQITRILLPDCFRVYPEVPQCTALSTRDYIQNLGHPSVESGIVARLANLKPVLLRLPD